MEIPVLNGEYSQGMSVICPKVPQANVSTHMLHGAVILTYKTGPFWG